MKRVLCGVLLALALATPAAAQRYLGDFPDDATVYCFWSSNNGSGASITRSTNGTISVYKDDNTTQTTTGVTDTEDYDTTTGLHLVKVATTDSFYATGSEFTIVLTGATIDTQTVNAPLCSFSIERTGGALALIKARTPSAAAGAAGGLLIHAGTTMQPGITVVKGSTGVILTVQINATTGAPLTGLAFNSSGLVGEYCRDDQGNANCTAITLATATRGTWTTGGFIEKDTTAGAYELHVPNAAFATGASRVLITLSGVSGMASTIIPVELVSVGTDTLAATIGTPLDTDLVTDVQNTLETAHGTYRRNVASQRAHPIFFRSTASPQSGLTGLGTAFTVTVSKDGAAFAATTGTKAELANGAYTFTPSASDLDCNTCYFQATGSNAVPYFFYIFTIP